MDDRAVLRLQRIAACAEEIRTRLRDLAAAENGRVHFRPTDAGITMVGLRPECPQSGRGGYSAERLLENFEEEFRKHCVPPGRPVPEKRLQSFLTCDAYLHDRRFEALCCAAGNCEAAHDLVFITDELALMSENGKVVCDILALRHSSGHVVPVLMELKARRLMSRLIAQLDSYSSLMEDYYPQFDRIYSAVLGQEVRFSGPPEKWLVWPGDIEHVDRREAELCGQGIRVVQCQETRNGFAFRIGHSPEPKR